MTWMAGEISFVLSFVGKLVALVSVQGFLVRLLVRRVTRHSVALWAQSTGTGARTTYRFAVQNNEDVPLTGPGAIIIRLEDRSARFADAPLVFAGCKELLVEDIGRANEWLLRFDLMPPYDSWTVTFRTTIPTAVVMQITGGDSRLSHSRIRLSGADSSVVLGTRVSPDWLFAGFAILSAECAYFAPIALGWPYPAFRGIDVVIGGALAGFGVLVLSMISRKPRPVVQGYWKPSVLGTVSVPTDRPFP